MQTSIEFKSAPYSQLCSWQQTFPFGADRPLASIAPLGAGGGGGAVCVPWHGIENFRQWSNGGGGTLS